MNKFHSTEMLLRAKGRGTDRVAVTMDSRTSLPVGLAILHADGSSTTTGVQTILDGELVCWITDSSGNPVWYRRDGQDGPEKGPYRAQWVSIEEAMKFVERLK